MATQDRGTARWADLVRESRPDLLALGAAGGPPREVATYGPITCADLAVGHGWGVQAAYDVSPGRADLEAALRWLRGRGAPGWGIDVTDPDRSDPVWRSLSVVDRKPVYAMAPTGAALMQRELPRGLVLSASPTHDDVVDGYGGWMDDRRLAELLVTSDDLAHQRRRFVCGYVDGRVVGCALVWWSRRTAYLSGIGVLAADRGRGYGWAVTAEAARVAVDEAPAGDPDVVWMYATDDGAALYSRMGFERIDVHESLGEQ